MTLIRWNPVRDVTAWRPVSKLANEFLDMQREIDRILDWSHDGTIGDSSMPVWMPAVDILEGEDDFTIKAELPGVSKEDVKVTVRDDVLTIRGRKKQESEKKGDNYYRVERTYGSFQRSFTLPSSVSGENIEASFDNGILTINLPKEEEAKSKEIDVKVK